MVYKKTALITGITGQDGSYLAEFLMAKDYEVHGVIRRASSFNTERIDHIYIDPHIAGAKLFLHYGDLSDSSQLTNLVYDTQPDEIYHLGAQSHVRVSFDIPEYSGDITGLGTTRLLEAVKKSGIKTKFYQASSSEMFGGAQAPQSEETPFWPKSPYAIAKVYAYWMAVNYREGYNMFCCNGILFNHESPRRGETFVTRKITRAIVNIICGNQKQLYLGNLSARRDWGYAPEYVECQWKILQQEQPDDYVIGQGKAYTVREFVEKTFSYAGIEITWQGEGIEEYGIITSVDKKWDDYGHLQPGTTIIKIDPKYFRPAEVHTLIADASKAYKKLDWQPKVSISDLVAIMMDADMEKAGLICPGKSKQVLKEKGFNWLTCP